MFYRDVLQTVYSPTQSRIFNVVLERGDDLSYRSSQVLLLFCIKSVGIAECGGELVFRHYFQITHSVNETDVEPYSVHIRWAAEDEIDHSIWFSPSNYGTIKAGKWYEAAPFSFIVSIHHIMPENNYVPLFCPELPRLVHRFYVNRFHQY